MGIEENKAMTERFYEEVINQGNLELAGQYIVEEAKENEEINESGLENLKQFYRGFRAAFPDLKFTIKEMIAEGDKVAVRMIISGTHNGTGNFMGFVPNGGKLKIEGIDIIRFEDGMMVEHWGKADYLGMLEQLDQPLTRETINNIRSNP